MKKIIPILLVAVILAACDGTFRTKKFQSTACAGQQVTGYTATIVAYGDSKLVVIPLSKIVPDTEWRFILRPIELGKARPGVDFKNSMVTIKGKRFPGDDDWIEVKGTYNGTAGDKHTLRECVEPPDTTPGTSYTFLVEVDDVGTLDPRADIVE